MFSPAAMSTITAAFLGAFVEVVEAFTIVLAVGITRSWRPALQGTALALAILVVLVTRLPVAAVGGAGEDPEQPLVRVTPTAVSTAAVDITTPGRTPRISTSPTVTPGPLRPAELRVSGL